ncbi:DNA-directed RNA polymerase III subunit RPC8-like [Papaver somniferum]|uniref:DNA-directed RNA polymerase III subunit RPC8-like n=1 Tax=Papaver somniferum TaxID=3469 RepID=UPI000E704D38|nr:DNA-directed RNA polymerase III subunit RPC8-like [Papaver somniferum]
MLCVEESSIKKGVIRGAECSKEYERPKQINLRFRFRLSETVINSIQNYSTEDKKTPHSRFEEGPVEEVEIFFLSLVEHTLRLPPHLLSLPLPEAIQGELEKLFVDKVIAQLGLCISVYDIKSIKGGFIFAGDGASTYTVDFRLIMFRPFEGDILSGKVDASDANGLRLSVGFFKDISVPVHLLPNPSKFSEDGRWTWMYGEVELTIEQDDEIRFPSSQNFIPSHPA